MLGPESRIKEHHIWCIWVLDRIPQVLPESPYLGMILWPANQVVVFSITKDNYTYEWEAGVNVKWSWVNPKRQNKNPATVTKLLKPSGKPRSGNQNYKRKYVAKTLSGVDREFLL